jgi:hypothetical protein
MDRNTAKTVNAEIAAALKDILAKHGLTQTRLTGRFTASTLDVKIGLADRNHVAQVNSSILDSHGLKLGQVFNYCGKTYKISGTRVGRSFDWILADRTTTGRTFKFRAHQLNAYTMKNPIR